MKLHPFVVPAAAGLLLSLAFLAPLPGNAQSSQVITLDPPTGLDLLAHTTDGKGNPLPEAPANFRRLGEARVGQLADLHTLTLRFHQTTRITGISVSKDFTIEQGGSCVEGNVYAKDTTCRLLVRLTPQGPGTRTGKLTIAHNASATPDAFGLGGMSFMPVVSFIPSTIYTVPGTYPSSKGLLTGAQDLAVDGGDDLYLADTGNNAIRWMDSSGNIKTISDSLKTSAPYGVAVDSFGDVWFSEPSKNALYEILQSGPTNQANGTGTDTCTPSSPCQLGKEALVSPGAIGIDPASDLMVFENNADGYHQIGVSYVQPYPPSFYKGIDQYPYVTSPMGAFAVDPSDNLYTSLFTNSTCQIEMETFASANVTSQNTTYHKVVGGRTCGFAGDGGQAAGAEISSTIGQIAFDAGGNMYFTDTGNQRVRRVDSATGIIRTIAGTGTAGYNNDGYAATSAELANPTGVGVDSQGQVYIISGAAATGTAQVVRKIGVIGRWNFGNQLRMTPSSTITVIVTNTGNDLLTVANYYFAGANPQDFSIDFTATSCFVFNMGIYGQDNGAVLAPGETCRIGFVFTPQAAGSRSATFVALDNSVTNANYINLNGNGILPTPTFRITSPINGASYNSGVSVPLTATVTSTTAPAPTGTVQFIVDGANYGPPVTLTTGTASTTVTSLTVATHKLSATYSGDSNFAAAGPISVSITVNTAPTVAPKVSLVPAISAAGTCQFPSFAATVTAASGVPTGLVQLRSGNAVLAAGELRNGQTVLAPPPLPSGTYSFTAFYGGDSRNQPAVSPVLKEYIAPQANCGRLIPQPLSPGRMEMR